MGRIFTVRDILYLWSMEAAARECQGDASGKAEALHIIGIWSARDMDAPFLGYFHPSEKIAAAELLRRELIAKHGEPPADYPPAFEEWCQTVRADVARRS